MTPRKDGRYLDDREGYFSDEQKRRTAKRSREMENRRRGDLKRQKNRARSMSYFDEIMTYDGVRTRELQEFRKKGGKVVGTMCVMIPFELIGAAGAEGVRLCSGFYEPVHPANELLGDAGLCPMVKSILGTKMVSADPMVDEIDLVVGPATCDGKMKLAEILQDWVDVVMVNMPRVKLGETNPDLWTKEIGYLKKQLELLTGNRITRKRLKAEIMKWNRAQKLWTDIVELRKEGDPPISGQDAMLVVQSSQKDRIDRWNRKVEKLLNELSGMKKKGVRAGEMGAARLLLSGSPMIYPNFKIPSIIEESGGTIIADELCSGFRLVSDPVILEDHSMKEMLRALAERYFFPCTCPCFSPNDKRIRSMKEAIRTYGAEGVVFHTLRGCHLNNLEATKIEMELRRMKVPILKLESEYDEGDVEQVRTRVEAFVEMIKARREFKRKKEVGKV